MRWIECFPLSLKLAVTAVKAWFPIIFLIQMKNYSWRGVAVPENTRNSATIIVVFNEAVSIYGRRLHSSGKMLIVCVQTVSNIPLQFYRRLQI